MATAFKDTRPALPFIHPDDMPDLYAIVGTGTCMEPVIADGATLVFDKTQEPRPGDIVGLTFTKERAARCGLPGLVKRLRFALPPQGMSGPTVTGLIVVEQTNPPRTYTFRAADVLAVHKCVGFAESAGQGRARFATSQEPPR